MLWTLIEAELVNIKNKHGKRVAYISICMAEYWKIQGDELQDLAMCALLHDNALTQYISEELKKDSVINCGSIIFLMGLAPNVLGYRHPAAILDRSKNKCCGLITDGEELKNNQLCFSVDTTVLHLFSDLSRTCPRTSGGWIPPLALTPKNNRSVSFLVA